MDGRERFDFGNGRMGLKIIKKRYPNGLDLAYPEGIWLCFFSSLQNLNLE